jgi:ABC-type dipeptide/oligopeptide/nickel transport system permease subunit
MEGTRARAMSITVIGISLVGDGLREVLDPRLGGR